MKLSQNDSPQFLTATVQGSQYFNKFRISIFILGLTSLFWWNVAVVTAKDALAAPPLPDMIPRIGPGAEQLPPVVTNRAVAGLTGYAVGQSEIGFGREVLSNADDMDTRSTEIDLDQIELPKDFAFPTVAKHERWIRVDIGNQQVIAYQGTKPIRAFVVSTGLANYPTVTGEFRIRMKVSEQTMSGADFYLPGVKWVQYFYSEYAFHGTYWHDDFGIPKSHGCVNMTNADAKWLFDWAGPVWDQETVWFRPTTDNPGTLVLAHE